MAQLQDEGSKKGKQKKISIHVDFTPMVDMNMLLICFFMLATSLSKPQTMEIGMPSTEKIAKEEQNKVADSRAITLILGGNDKIYYYFGQPDYNDFSTLQETTYNADGLRAMLLNRNRDVVKQMNELKQKRLDHQISDEDYDEQLSEISKSKTSPIVMIKGSESSTYKNLVDALDEMNICNISTYAIVDITEGDDFLVNNLLTQGELTRNIDTRK